MYPNKHLVKCGVLDLLVCLFIYIYIYVERERESKLLVCIG